MAVYALSDLHGRYDIYQKIVNFLNPEDTVYCLGDFGDRGPEPWKTLYEALNNPQFIYLKGNHEDILYNALEEKITGQHYRYWPGGYEICVSNGGQQTFEQCLAEDKGLWYMEKFHSLKEYAVYTNKKGQVFFLSHSGISPKDFLEDALYGRSEFSCEVDLIWNRSHYYNPYWLEGFENLYIVHGHTPIEIMCRELHMKVPKGHCEYCEGHKINLDTGAVWTGKSVLFNLDTFESTIFYGEEFDSILN